MKLLGYGYVLLWLAIVGCFTVFGFVERQGDFPSPYAIEPIVAFAAIGIGAASYIVAGLIVIKKLRAECFGRGAAAAMLFLSAVASVIIPVLIVSAVAMATRRSPSDNRVELFGGEHGLWVLAVGWYSFWITLAVLLVFAVWALVLAKYKPKQSISA